MKKRASHPKRVTDQNTAIWSTFTDAIGAELRPDKRIQGISGLEHQVQAIAVDDKGKRVIIISAEANPRISALMRVDVQATMPDTRVLVARPLLVNIGELGRRAFGAPDGGLDQTQLASFAQAFQMPDGKERDALVESVLGTAIEPIKITTENLKLPFVGQLITAVEQLGMLNWPQILDGLKDNPSMWRDLLKSIVAVDNLKFDRELGICPVPLYEFKSMDWEALKRGGDLDEVQSRLRELGIYQFFYPPADQVALGLVDKGFHESTLVARGLAATEEMGHRLSEPELIRARIAPSELINDIGALPHFLQELKEVGYVADAKIGYEITEEGKTKRLEVNTRPREGIFTRILNRISVTFSASGSDFLK